MPEDLWRSSAGVKLRAEYRAHCLELNYPCWLCGQPIDYGAAPQTPNSFEPDHFLPRDEHPELALEWENLRPAHCNCNRSRGKRDAPAALGPTTIAW